MEVLILIVVLILSVIFHEVMHGYMADKLGDPTARHLGRLTLNPIPHIDPLMSLLLPAMLIFSSSPIIFGAAKPVPVNYLNLREGRRDMAIVALAGPLTNIVIAVTAALIYHALPINLGVFKEIMFVIIQINLVLGILNLIPIPPLDGSKVISFFLPENLASVYYSLEQYGILILFFLLFFPLGGFSLGAILEKLLLNALRLLGI